MPDTPDSCGANLLANELLPNLLGDNSFDIPLTDVNGDAFQIPPEEGNPLYSPVQALINADLTTREVGGLGTFDALMSGISAHLKKELEHNRITGQEYTKAFIGLTEAAMTNATQFLLGRDQAYWQAMVVQQQARLTQMQAIKARAELEIAKVGLIAARYQALQAEVEYGLTKMKLATEDATFCNIKAQTRQTNYNTDSIMPEQVIGIELDNAAKVFTNTNILPVQRELLEEQVEVQRAQTLDVRKDNTTITGSIGKQKALYSQQIVSYQRDAEVKAAKLFTDAWITQKTLDEGLTAPHNFTNTSMDQILGTLKINNALGTNTAP